MSILASDVPVIDVDPWSEEVLAHPEEVDALVREAGPIVRLGKHGLWATGRHEVASRILRDWELFSSASGTGLANNRLEKPWRPPSVILESDPPGHDVVREVMTEMLAPASVRRLAAEIAERADVLVERLVAKGEFDAGEELAKAFPLEVLPDAVGMAKEGRENLLPYSAFSFSAFGPMNEVTERFRDGVTQEVLEYVEWQSRREALTTDGFGARLYEAADAGRITHREAQFLVRTFISAGMDTTILGLSVAIRELAANPEQWALLRADPSLARAAFEEAVRFTAPSQFLARTTTRPAEFEGASLGAPEKIVVFIAAANRDPRRFEDPDVFDIRRRAIGHLAFGNGLHGCVGQILARLEAESLLGAMARRIERIELTGEPTMFVNNWLRGWDHIPVRVSAG
jgi:cytochrome P450